MTKWLFVARRKRKRTFVRLQPQVQLLDVTWGWAVNQSALSREEMQSNFSCGAGNLTLCQSNGTRSYLMFFKCDQGNCGQDG